jgi:mono/diheme cytochrome c family protein
VTNRLIGAALGAIMSATASATAFAAGDPVTERGRAIAQKQCARCHAIGRTGKSPMEPAPPFREIPKRYPVENLAEALAEGIMVGHPAMPEFRFDPPEIDALLSYLQSLSPRK